MPRIAAALVLAFSIGLLTAPPLLAQISDEIRVQGRLTTPGGAPITDPTTVTFRVHSHVSAGVVNFTETEIVTPDATGTFQAVLGDGVALDPEIFAEPRWLGVEIDGGGELTPRIAMLPAPSALRAKSAKGLNPDLPVDLAGETLTGIPTPAAASDATPKSYVDAGDSALSGSLAAHTGDGSIHYTQQAISIPSTKISDFDTAVSNSTHGSAAGIHFTQASISIIASQISNFDSAVSESSHGTDSNNPHAVDKADVGLGNVADTLDNLAANRAPTTTDSTGAGYSVGSHWISTNSATAYVLTSAPTPTGAVWRAVNAGRTVVQVTPVYAGGGLDPVASGAALELALSEISGATAEAPVVLRLAPGRYDTSGSLVLPDNVTVEGAGRHETSLHLSGGISFGTVARIRDLTIQADPLNGFALFLAANDQLHLDRVAILGSGLGAANFYAIYATASDVGIYLRDVEMDLQGTGAGLLAGVYSLSADNDIVFEMADTDIELAWSFGAATAVHLEGGTLDVQGGELTVAGSGEAVGIRADATNHPRVRVDGTRLKVDSTGGGNATGVDYGAIEVEVRDTRVEVFGAEARGISGTGNDSTLAGNKVLVSSTAAAYGIEDATSGNHKVVEGNRIDVSPGSGASYGIHLFANYIAASGNLIEINAGSSSGDVYGFRAYALNGSLAGTTVRVDSTNSGSLLRGIQTRGNWWGLAGARVQVQRLSGSSGGAYGLHLEAGTSVAGCSINVSNHTNSGTTAGIFLNATGDAQVSGTDLIVVGDENVRGILTFSGNLSLSGSELDVNGDGAFTHGVDAADDFLGSSLNVDVENADATGDAIGVACASGATEECVVGSSTIKVSALGSGTSSVFDQSDGAASPDARIDGSRNVADVLGTDVTCTDSACF